MDVSVVCPIHGSGKYLYRTLDSIKRQSFKGSMEVILVLDRCSEEILTIIDSFRSEIVIKIYESKNPGLVSALNMGLQMATGKYVARIDSDDLMAPSRIERQLEFLEANQQITVLGSSVTEINEHGVVIGKREYPTESIEMYNSLSKQCTIAHPSVMFKRDEILNLGGYRPFFENAEDYDLWLRVRERGAITSTFESLTFYRIHPGQISTLQLEQRVFGSYSARINCILEKKGMKNLISRYGTFERWGNSRVGKFLLQYVSFRLLITRKIQNFENGNLEVKWLEKLVIGKVLLPFKRWKKRRKT
jgi:glycosyltransferase involved in cell wall biosynthesis